MIGFRNNDLTTDGSTVAASVCRVELLSHTTTRHAGRPTDAGGEASVGCLHEGCGPVVDLAPCAPSRTARR